MGSTSYNSANAACEADMILYGRLLAGDNSAQMGRLKRNLSAALRQDVTPKQRQYLMLYYGKGMSLNQISKTLGVDKSTVSRTMKRGRERLYRCLRYGASSLLEDGKSAE